MSTVYVGLSCDGSCGDAATLKKNIEKQASDDFDFVKSKNHIPALEGTWVQKPKEEPPGVFFTKWDAKEPGGAQEEHHVIIERLVTDTEMLLRCAVEVKEHDSPWTDRLEKACRSAELEIVK